MKKMLVALLPLLVLGKSEMMQKDQKEKELNRYKVHQEDDFRAPDFDLSQSGPDEYPRVLTTRFFRLLPVPDPKFLTTRQGRG